MNDILRLFDRLLDMEGAVTLSPGAMAIPAEGQMPARVTGDLPRYRIARRGSHKEIERLVGEVNEAIRQDAARLLAAVCQSVPFFLDMRSEAELVEKMTSYFRWYYDDQMHEAAEAVIAKQGDTYYGRHAGDNSLFLLEREMLAVKIVDVGQVEVWTMIALLAMGSACVVRGTVRA